MKQQASNVRYYLRVFKQQFIFAWQSELAYVSDILGELASTLLYNIAYIVFLNFLLRKIPTIAGYTLNDMLVLSFISQVVYYAILGMAYDTFTKFNEYVRHGKFDLLVIKPLSLFYQVVTLGIRPFAGIFFSIPPLAIYAVLIIQRGALHPTPYGAMMGILCMIVGTLLLFFYRFTFTLPIFFTKKSKDLTKTLDFFTGFGTYPFESYRDPLRTVFLLGVPMLAAGGISSSYLLNKSTSVWPFITECLILALFIFLTISFWRKGLREYESASS